VYQGKLPLGKKKFPFGSARKDGKDTFFFFFFFQGSKEELLQPELTQPKIFLSPLLPAFTSAGSILLLKPFFLFP